MRLSFLVRKADAIPQSTAAPQPVTVSAAPAAPAAPAASPASVAKAPVAPVQTPSEQPSGSEPVRRTRTQRTAASLSMKSVMEGPQVKETVQVQNDSAPSDEVLKAKWPELAKVYESKPRLASMLTSTTLEFSDAQDGMRTVTFRVVNEAQKEWVESKLLHELEGNFRKIVASSKIFV